MDSAPALAAPDALSATLRTILRGLLAALGGFGLEAAQGLILYRRISAVAGRIERMLIRFRAGRLWRMPERAARNGAIRQACRIDTLPRLPRRFGWLVRIGGYRAAGFGSQLQTVLSTPEMVELLAASPQAVRLLRPLCRALALEVPGIVARPVAKSGERPIRRRRPRPKPEPFRIPLPRGVLTAARRAGFGKDF